MEQEIAMLGRQRGRLDETLLTLMDGIETTDAELTAASARRDAAEARWKAQDELFRRRWEPAIRRYFELAVGRRPPRELYDLRADPDQLNNIADAPRYALIADEMDRTLIANLRRTGDMRVGPDPERWEEPGRGWGDQGFVRDHWHGRVVFWQDALPDAVVSYKADVLGKGIDRGKAIVLVSHGRPRPWEEAGADEWLARQVAP